MSSGQSTPTTPQGDKAPAATTAPGKQVPLFFGAAPARGGRQQAPSTRGRQQHVNPPRQGASQPTSEQATPTAAAADWHYSQQSEGKTVTDLINGLKLNGHTQEQQQYYAPPTTEQSYTEQSAIYAAQHHQQQPAAGQHFAGYPAPSQPVPQHNVPLRVNVGGRLFELLSSTASKYPNSPLASLVSQNAALHGNVVFFDRDPAAFEVVLGFMRAGKVYRPEWMSIDLLRDEAAFWGVAEAMFPPEVQQQIVYRKSFTFSLTSDAARFTLMLLPHEGLSITSMQGEGILLLDVLSLERQPIYENITVHDTRLAQATGAGSGRITSAVFAGGRIYEFYGKSHSRSYSHDGNQELNVDILCDKVYYFQPGEQVSS